jgi:CRISPR/Cas system endoribonuclease Cas6 (RAMP superfamily)
MSSISSFTLRIAVGEPIVFQSFSGFAACGLFYNLVKLVDEDFAERLHSSRKLAPWSATPFFVELPSSRIVFRFISAPSIVNVSFSIMDDRLSNVFREAILKPDLHVDLVNVKAKVIGVAVNTYRFSDLASNVNPLPSKFAIRFLTPTVFRRSIFDCCPHCPYYLEYIVRAKSDGKVEKPCKYAIRCGGMLVPLPLPSLMFRNIARIWSAFSDIRLDVEGAARWAENAIMVSGFPKQGIRTTRVYEHPTTNKWIIGFMGMVRFVVREELYREVYAKIAATLLKMAEITNMGVRRTAGFGMIKYLTPKEKEETKIHKEE